MPFNQISEANMQIVVFIIFFSEVGRSIIGLVVKFPLAMREPRVRYRPCSRITNIPNDAVLLPSSMEFTKQIVDFDFGFATPHKKQISCISFLDFFLCSLVLFLTRFCHTIIFDNYSVIAFTVRVGNVVVLNFHVTE